MSTYRSLKEAAQQEGQVEVLTPTFMSFEEAGDNVVGRLKAVSSVNSTVSEGMYNQYLFETDDGLIKFHLGMATDNEAGGLMVIGQVYYVEFQGKQSIGKNRSVNKFHVERIIEKEAV